jgi:hypothetical protein
MRTVRTLVNSLEGDLESGLGSRPHEFESRILPHVDWGNTPAGPSDNRAAPNGRLSSVSIVRSSTFARGRRRSRRHAASLQSQDVTRCLRQVPRRRRRRRGRAASHPPACQVKGRTTIANRTADRAPDLVSWQFRPVPNRLLVADLTYVRMATGCFVSTGLHTCAGAAGDTR